jgi:hypothetical protein
VSKPLIDRMGWRLVDGGLADLPGRAWVALVETKHKRERFDEPEETFVIVVDESQNFVTLSPAALPVLALWIGAITREQ